MKRILKKRENRVLDKFMEMVVIGRRDADKKLKKGMKLIIYSSEYHGTGEEHHMHLYPASHKPYIYDDLITKIKVTETPPKSPDDVVAIKDNPPVPKEYQEAIFE